MLHRLVLWDVDGTLLSTGDLGRQALERGAAEVAGLAEVPHVSMGGKTDPQIVAEILGAAGIGPARVAHLVPEALAAAERHLAAWRGRIAVEGHLHPGVHDVLAELERTPGVRQTLLTGNVAPNAFVKVDAFGLARFFDFAIGAYGSDHAEREHLVPVALERVARLRGERFAPHEVWVVGDTANDLRCARAGGVRCLLVGTGRQGPAALDGLAPDALFADLSDVGGVLEVLLGGR